jgi:hypothetical protein
LLTCRPHPAEYRRDEKSQTLTRFKETFGMPVCGLVGDYRPEVKKFSAEDD